MSELVIKASLDMLGEVFSLVETKLADFPADFPADLQANILTAVEEIFVNIVSYAYQTDQENVKVSISANGKVVIRFEDSGIPYNPLEQESPDLDVPLMEREIGGLGIHFVRNLMDKVEYSYSDNKNILTITKEVK